MLQQLGWHYVSSARRRMTTSLAEMLSEIAIREYSV